MARNVILWIILRANQHEDGLPSVGLFFSRVELDNLGSTVYSSKFSFDKSFFDELFDLTDGHVEQSLISYVQFWITR